VNPHRTLRRWLSVWLVLAILFTQIAVAAYACPSMRGEAQADAERAGMPCAEMMGAGLALDAEQPGLCLQHCQFGSNQQPADSQPPLGAAAPVLLPLFRVTPSVATSSLRAAWSGHERARQRVPRTASSILHCCYRI